MMSQNQEMEFLSVEYLVPFEFHTADADPPALFFQHFHANLKPRFWAPHVWTERKPKRFVL